MDKQKRLPKEFNLKISRDFGWQIKKMREECGLSQKELAIKIGLKSGTAVCLWESNKRLITALNLWRIASVCGYIINLEVYAK